LSQITDGKTGMRSRPGKGPDVMRKACPTILDKVMASA
jgi:hypothetical protein